jgi:hypothetical protein
MTQRSIEIVNEAKRLERASNDAKNGLQNAKMLAGLVRALAERLNWLEQEVQTLRAAL